MSTVDVYHVHICKNCINPTFYNLRTKVEFSLLLVFYYRLYVVLLKMYLILIYMP